MGSEESGLVQAQRLDKLHQGQQARLHTQLVLPDGFTCGGTPPPQRGAITVGDLSSKKTTRELSGFINNQQHDYFPDQKTPEFRRSIFGDHHHQRPGHQDTGFKWTSSGYTCATPSGEGSEDDDADDGDDDTEDDNDVEGLISERNNNSKYNIEKISYDTTNNSDSFENPSTKQAPEPGLKEGTVVVGQSVNVASSEMRNAVTTAETDGRMYYARYLQGKEESNGGQKDMMVENGVGFSGRKEGSYSTEPRESLRAILSDPLTGALMDDAMILPCGHSFGSGGMQHVLRMKACYRCAHAVSEDSVAPNLSLRAAIQAFRREEALHVSRASKRRRERYDPEKGTYGDSTPLDHRRGCGVQFPFAVHDRVIIKGNKRTPQRFVGREAIVTTQCLNGWYVVKTMDNSESVKLQYRSLARMPNDQSSKPVSTEMTPNRL